MHSIKISKIASNIEKELSDIDNSQDFEDIMTLVFDHWRIQNRKPTKEIVDILNRMENIFVVLAAEKGEK